MVITERKDHLQLLADRLSEFAKNVVVLKGGMGIKERRRVAQTRALVSVNSEMIKLYWRIGRDILERQEQQGWGTKIVDRLAADLRKEFPGVEGYSPRNLKYMRNFAAAWPEEIVQRVVAQLPWGQNIELLAKLDDTETRLWYAKAAIQHGWSRPVLVHQIETNLHERDGRSLNNFTATLPPPDSDMVTAAFKDSYVLDFVALEADAHERRLEAKLIERIRDFLLELGRGFAFVGSQYHLEVGGQDFYIDLLFYHIPLRRYVVVELKTGDFTPEIVGQVGFYLTAVDRQIKSEQDGATVGLVLCRRRNKVIADYALTGVVKPMAVSEFTHTILPPALAAALPGPEEVESKLSDLIAESEAEMDEDEAII